MSNRFTLTILTATMSAALPLAAALALPIELVNQTNVVSASEANDHSFGPSSASGDGRYAVFYSAASNLVPGDTNGLGDLFLHDANAGTRERINVGFGGVQANALTSRTASVSNDGRFVVFSSRATNLGATQIGVREQVYLRDRQLQTTTLLTHAANGSPFPADSSDPRLTPDGRYVVFSCNGPIVGADTNQVQDIYRLDRTTGEFVLVSVSTSGEPGNHNSYDAQISDDGNSVVFYTEASNLLAGDTNFHWDLALRDISGGTTALVSATVEGLQLDGYATLPPDRSVSSNGRFVVFSTYSAGGISDTNDDTDAFRFDSEDGSVSRITLDSNGQQINGSSVAISLSSDGKKLLFGSYASNVTAGLTGQVDRMFMRDLESGAIVHVPAQTGASAQEEPGYAQAMSADSTTVYFMHMDYESFGGVGNDFYKVFRRHLTTSTTGRISGAYAGYSAASANQHSGLEYDYGPSVSEDGRYVAFDSRASNLVVGDNNGVPDVFVRDRLTATTQRITNNTALIGNCGSDAPTISSDGRYVAFVSCTTAFPGAAGGFDIYRLDRQTGETLLVSAYPGTGMPSGYSIEPHMSDNGNVIAFVSCATLTNDDVYPYCDVYVRDLRTGSLTLASRVLSAGSGDSDSLEPQISGNGRFVAFNSFSSNLVNGDFNNVPDVFVVDLTTRQLERVSVGNAGAEGDAGSYLRGISSDGSAVLFASYASNFSGPAGNMYIRHRDESTSEWVSHDYSGISHNVSQSAALSADGRRVAFVIYSYNSQDEDNWANEQVIVHDLATRRIYPVLEQPANGFIQNMHFSKNRDFLVFRSNATNLGPYDGNHRFRDVFIAKDLNDRIFDAGFE